MSEELVRVAVDAMGGDNAPGEIVKGAVQALKEDEGIHVLLTGRPELIREELKGYSFPEERLTIVPASEVIETGEPPVHAIRHKKDSSLVVGLRLVHCGEADAVVSAGSTGAILAGGQLIVGRLKGVRRTPIASLIPTENGFSLLIDAGASVDPGPEQLVQYARMGSVYMEQVVGVRNPAVGLLNIGTEEEKGNALSKSACPLLRACGDIRFIGNVEAREIPHGACDVIVCDAFTGNVALKMYEGVASAMMNTIRRSMTASLRSKLGALLVRPALKKEMKRLDISEYGGAPLLGLNGLVVKTHGSSDAAEVKNSVLQCAVFCRKKVTETFRQKFCATNP